MSTEQQIGVDPHEWVQDARARANGSFADAQRADSVELLFAQRWANHSGLNAREAACQLLRDEEAARVEAGLPKVAVCPHCGGAAFGWSNAELAAGTRVWKGDYEYHCPRGIAARCAT